MEHPEHAAHVPGDPEVEPAILQVAGWGSSSSLSHMATVMDNDGVGLRKMMVIMKVMTFMQIGEDDGIGAETVMNMMVMMAFYGRL